MGKTVNHQWCLAARPVGMIKPTDFAWREAPIPTPNEGEILVRHIYLSLDPTNRGWMQESDGYLPSLPLGEVMRGATLSVVEESNNPDFQVGDLVSGILGWQEYAVSDGEGLTVLPKELPVPLTAHFGLFGHIGITAYFGLLDIGQPKEGETLVVSTAAGAVGSLVGQIGKIKGCRVVGIAGTDEKCRWLTEELGFDAAINYKTESVSEMLKHHCPDGIDIYFDNVGGETLEAALALININARIPLCGMISQYNATEPVPGPTNLINLVRQRARMEGFLILDYLPRAEEAITALAQWLFEEKIQYRVDTVDGLEQANTAVTKLFDGSNKGKLIVKVSDEPA